MNTARLTDNRNKNRKNSNQRNNIGTKFEERYHFYYYRNIILFVYRTLSKVLNIMLQFYI